MRRSRRPSRYARPRSLTRSCAVMKYAPKPAWYGSFRQRDAQMRFPDAGRSEQDYIAGFMNEAQCSELAHLAFVNRGLKAEIKLLEGFQKRQMRELQTCPQIPCSARFDFASEQLIQEIGIARFGLRGLFQ